MITLNVSIRLISDTTFGRGDGVAGVVDQEVEHDPVTGLPFVRGRTLKGLLVEACADILYSLNAAKALHYRDFEAAAEHLFGTGGSLADDAGRLRVGTAQLPDSVRADVETFSLSPADVLQALTTIRYQTAVEPSTGSPAEGSLRAARVVIRERVFEAQFDIDLPADDDYALALLAACTKATRRGGSGRGRGRGRLELSIVGEDETALLTCFEHLAGAKE